MARTGRSTIRSTAGTKRRPAKRNPRREPSRYQLGPANDHYEREADANADNILRAESRTGSASTGGAPATTRISRMPASSAVHRSCSSCGAKMNSTSLVRRSCSACEKKKDVQASGTGKAGGPISRGLSSRLDSMFASGGRPLPTGIQRMARKHLKQDFSDVKLHTGSEAAKTSHELGAEGFSAGRNVVIGAGKDKPETPEGKHLMMHELSHVAQQGAAKTIRRRTAGPGTRTPTTLPRPRRTLPRNVPIGHRRRSPKLSKSDQELIKKALKKQIGRQKARLVLTKKITKQVFQKIVFKEIAKAVAKRFAVRAGAAALLAAIDGPLPVGDLLALGLTIYMVYELIQEWGKITAEAEAEALRQLQEPNLPVVAEGEPDVEPVQLPSRAPDGGPAPRPDPEPPREPNRESCDCCALSLRVSLVENVRNFRTLGHRWKITVLENYPADAGVRQFGRTPNKCQLRIDRADIRPRPIDTENEYPGRTGDAKFNDYNNDGGRNCGFGKKSEIPYFESVRRHDGENKGLTETKEKFWKIRLTSRSGRTPKCVNRDVQIRVVQSLAVENGEIKSHRLNKSRELISSF